MRGALGFLTVLGGARAPGRWTLWWFPVVGAGLGASVAAAHWGAHELWGPAVAAAMVVAVDLVLTGALHLDGLADSADGLLPHMERPRRLAVMAQPDVGAFAVGVVFTVLLVRWALFTDPGIEPWSFVAVWAIGRTLAAVIPALVPYARSDGLASPLLHGASAWLAVWLLPSAAVLVAVSGVNGAVALGAAIAGGVAVVGLARRRLGGFTGDVLGAVIVLSETAALLALAAQP